MGEERQILCEDCEEFVDVGKDLTFSDRPFGRPEIALEFIDDHQCCTLRLVGEYSGQRMWLNANERNGWEKYQE